MASFLQLASLDTPIDRHAHMLPMPLWRSTSHPGLHSAPCIEQAGISRRVRDSVFIEHDAHTEVFVDGALRWIIRKERGRERERAFFCEINSDIFVYVRGCP